MCDSDSGEAKVALKNYIVTLRFKGMQKRVWFVGEDSPKCRARFAEACHALDAVGDRCSEWMEFITSAVAHFGNYGFSRIPR